MWAAPAAGWVLAPSHPQGGLQFENISGVFPEVALWPPPVNI